jgi:hypothetical protein
MKTEGTKKEGKSTTEILVGYKREKERIKEKMSLCGSLHPPL